VSKVKLISLGSSGFGSSPIEITCGNGKQN